MNKTVNLNLIGVDGNAFSILAAFRKQAKKEKWSDGEIEAVTTDAQNGNYDYLLATISAHCEPPERDE